MKATLISSTVFLPSGTGVPWEPEPEIADGDSLIEFAGRACYESWDRPNKKTSENGAYIGHILEVGHNSVLEHASAGFYITGVSRSLTHELVRHRHFSYSQLSQRYVDSRDTAQVIPPEAKDDHVLEQLLWLAFDQQLDTYNMVIDHLEKKLADLPIGKTERRKRARQTARSVLGNFTETKVVMTGNYRAWRHFVGMRATAAADTEIRALAIEILRQLQDVSPGVFNDFIIQPYEGTEIANSVIRGEIE